MVSAWLEEDCPSFDYGGFVVGEGLGEARLLGKSAVGFLSNSTEIPHSFRTVISNHLLLFNLGATKASVCPPIYVRILICVSCALMIILRYSIRSVSIAFLFPLYIVKDWPISR